MAINDAGKQVNMARFSFFIEWVPSDYD